jgi:hypothetical protein
MRLAIANVTDYGGRSCHAANVCWKLSIPAPANVGTDNGIERLRNVIGRRTGCNRGGLALIMIDSRLCTTKFMLNMADPDSALLW